MNVYKKKQKQDQAKDVEFFGSIEGETKRNGIRSEVFREEFEFANGDGREMSTNFQ
jgi:hypothetical protein